MWIIDHKAVLARRVLVELVILEKKATDAAVYRNVRLALQLVRQKVFPPKMWEELLEEEEIRRESIDVGDWDGNGDYISHMSSRKDFERYARRIREARRILLISATLLAGLPFCVGMYLVIVGFLRYYQTDLYTESRDDVAFIMQSSVVSLVVPLGILGASYWLEPLMEMKNNDLEEHEQGRTTLYSQDPDVSKVDYPPLEVRFSTALVLMLHLILGVWGFLLTNLDPRDRTVTTEKTIVGVSIILHLIGLYPSLHMIRSWSVVASNEVEGIKRSRFSLSKLCGVVYIPSANKWQTYGFCRFKCVEARVRSRHRVRAEKIQSHLNKLMVRKLQMEMRGFKRTTFASTDTKSYQMQLVYNETCADIDRLDRVLRTFAESKSRPPPQPHRPLPPTPPPLLLVPPKRPRRRRRRRR